MNRVTSFTEYTLLHRWALDLLSPSDFQKLPIPYTGDSALQALKSSPKNPHSNLRNESWWHLADQYYLLTPLQAIYVAAVTLTVSRVGALYHGVMTSFYYLKYRVSDDRETIKKTQEHAYATFVDGLSAGLGAVLTKIAVESIFQALHYAGMSSLLGPCYSTGIARLVNLTYWVAGVALSIAGLASVQSARIAPEFFVLQDHKVGLYLSLFFRKKLGLVGSDGGLLPFSAKDKLEYHGDGHFTGKNHDILWNQIPNAEFDLIQAVQDCNKLLPKQHLIPFRYPLDGDAIAQKLEELFYTKEEAKASMALASNDPILSKAAQIRALQLKIQYSKEIWETAREFTYNDGILSGAMKIYFKLPRQYLEKENRVSSIPRRDYQEYFTTFDAKFRRPSPDSSNASSGAGFGESRGANAEYNWSSVGIKSTNPNMPRPEQGIYAQFAYDLGVNKWNADNNNNDYKTFRELLGLACDATYEEYKKIKKQYLLACHPDKNGGTEEAGEIQKCLNAIIEKLDKEYKA